MADNPYFDIANPQSLVDFVRRGDAAIARQFVTDFGEDVPVLDLATGIEVDVLPRYALWNGNTGKIIKCLDSLDGYEALELVKIKAPGKHLPTKRIKHTEPVNSDDWALSMAGLHKFREAPNDTDQD